MPKPELPVGVVSAREHTAALAQRGGMLVAARDLHRLRAVGQRRALPRWLHRRVAQPELAAVVSPTSVQRAALAEHGRVVSAARHEHRLLVAIRERRALPRGLLDARELLAGSAGEPRKPRLLRRDAEPELPRFIGAAYVERAALAQRGGVLVAARDLHRLRAVGQRRALPHGLLRKAAVPELAAIVSAASVQRAALAEHGRVVSAARQLLGPRGVGQRRALPRRLVRHDAEAELAGAVVAAGVRRCLAHGLRCCGKNMFVAFFRDAVFGG